MLSVSARDNFLPFCNFCPCASATILGNDAAVFHTDAQLGPFSEEMLYSDYTTQLHFAQLHTIFICQSSGPCPNHFQTPFMLLGNKRIEFLNIWHFVENKKEIKQHDLKMQ
jgi:hypothetical protein